MGSEIQEEGNLYEAITSVLLTAWDQLARFNCDDFIFLKSPFVSRICYYSLTQRRVR